MAFSKKESAEIEKLVTKSKRGDAEAFGEIYDKFVVPIYRYVYYRVEKDEVEDLTEMVFLKAWEKRSSYHKQEGNSFNSWIFRIAHNTVVDYYRSKAKNENYELNEEIESDKTEENPREITQLKFEKLELTQAIRLLPTMQQQIIVLKFVNEMENYEIAEIVGKSVGAVRVIQFRALTKLKEILENNAKGSNESPLFSFET